MNPTAAAIPARRLAALLGVSHNEAKRHGLFGVVPVAAANVALASPPEWVVAAHDGAPPRVDLHVATVTTHYEQCGHTTESCELAGGPAAEQDAHPLIERGIDGDCPECRTTDVFSLPRWQRMLAAADPATAPELLAAVVDRESGSRNVALVDVAAGNPSLPPDSARAVLTSARGPRRAIAAGNPALPTSDVATLAADRSDEVRAAIAARTDLPAAVATLLADDHNPKVRATLAAHPDLPDHVAVLLADDRHPKVRAALHAAGRPCADVPDDDSGNVDELDRDRLLGVARSIRTSPATLAALAENDDLTIAASAAHNPMCPPDAAAHVRARLDVRFPLPDADDREPLADGTWDTLNPTIAAVWLADPDCPLARLEYLAAHPKGKVRAQVAAHPLCDGPMLHRLVGDSDELTAAAAAGHPQLPAAAAAALLERCDPDSPDPAVRGTVLAALAGNRNVDVADLIGAGPALYENWQVRPALLRRDDCPLHLYMDSRDPHRVQHLPSDLPDEVIARLPLPMAAQLDPHGTLARLPHDPDVRLAAIRIADGAANVDAATAAQLAVTLLH